MNQHREVAKSVGSGARQNCGQQAQGAHLAARLLGLIPCTPCL